MSMLDFYINRAGRNLSANRARRAGEDQGRAAQALRPRRQLTLRVTAHKASSSGYVEGMLSA